MVFLIGSLHLSRWQKRDMALTTNSRTAFFSRRTYQHNVAKHHINTFSRHLRLWMLLSGIRKIKRLEMMMSYILDWRQMSSVKSKGPKWPIATHTLTLRWCTQRGSGHYRPRTIFGPFRPPSSEANKLTAPPIPNGACVAAQAAPPISRAALFCHQFTNQVLGHRCLLSITVGSVCAANDLWNSSQNFPLQLHSQPFAML